MNRYFCKTTFAPSSTLDVKFLLRLLFLISYLGFGSLTANSQVYIGPGNGGGSGSGSGGGQPGGASSKWKLSVAYSGTASVTPENTFSIDTPGHVSIQGISSNNVDLSSSTVFHPAETNTGGMTVDLGGDIGVSAKEATLQFQGAEMIFTLTYQPASVAPPAAPDLPPTKIKISFRRSVYASSSSLAINAGESAVNETIGTISGGGASCSTRAASSIVGPSPEANSSGIPSRPEGFTTVDLSLDAATSSNPSPKTFTYRFQLSGSSIGGTTGPVNGHANASGSPHSQGGGGLHYTVDFCVDGYDLSRFGPLSGKMQHSGVDPSYTRWLPLSFSPKLNSQPFRIQAGALTAPGETSTVSIARN